MIWGTDLKRWLDTKKLHKRIFFDSIILLEFLGYIK